MLSIKSVLKLSLFSFLYFSANSYSADFVGVEQCIACHENEYQQWAQSHHDMSMRHADEESVLGDFNNHKLVVEQGRQIFYQKDNQYWISLTDIDGEKQDYKISYTLGYEPLQQYMVEFNDGRIQLIPFAWDSRPKQQGGQRWFHLYPHLDKHDEFYWKNPGQNWNYMCADCHSTNLKKNYDVASNSYKSTWTDINVACEACHGPGSEHIKLAENKTIKSTNTGFDADISPRVEEWQYNSNSPTLQSKLLKPTDQLKVCFQCHSRRTQISDSKPIHKTDFNDRYIMSTLSGDLYYPDGQIYDEVFVGGSFLQSKMHHKGVSCSNCHNPHSLELVSPKETLCFQCHSPTEYGSGKHSKHAANTEADQCVTCHMPETTYMEVDDRADHSFKVPRPDLSVKFNTPNVCTQCHKNESNNWASKILKQWYPDSKIEKDDVTETFYIADTAGDSKQRLIDIAKAEKYPNIIRASALKRLQNFPVEADYQSLVSLSKQADANIRLNVIYAATQLPIDKKWSVIFPLVSDDMLMVRVEAARELAMHWQQLSAPRRQAISKGVDEYIAYQQQYFDRGFGYLNIATIQMAQGKFQQAEKTLLNAIKLEPIFSKSYLNLADIYRIQGNDAGALKILKQGINAQPKDASLFYSAGLALYRQQKLADATHYFKQATEVEASNSHYWYVLSLAQDAMNLADSIESMQQAFELSNDPQYLLPLCEQQIKFKHDGAKQCIIKASNYFPQATINQLQRYYRKQFD